MKKAVICAALIAAIIASGLIYPTTMEIIDLKEADDEVILSTPTGFIYVMTGIEDWQIGDLVSLIMYTNGTPLITDDAILMARYSGYRNN